MVIHPESYPAILYLSLLGILLYYSTITSKTTVTQLVKDSAFGYSRSAICLSVLVACFLGFRPIHEFFVDTIPYAEAFKKIEIVNETYFTRGDIGFRYLMLLCSRIGLSTSGFFFLIASLYIGGITYVALKVFHRNAFIVLVAVFSTFFFYNYGVNGIRNGLASSLVFVAIYLHCVLKRPLIALGIALLALSIHISVLLVVVAYISHLFKSKTSNYLSFWFFCLFLSFLVGRSIETLAMGAGILDNWRNTNYLYGHNINMNLFSRTGYRWDFVLYSSPPIIWIWYWTIKRKFTPPLFSALSNIYLFTNGLWLLINQNWLSDRFAALSWFFHSFIFMYPLLHINYVSQRRYWIFGIIGGTLLFSILYKVW